MTDMDLRWKDEEAKKDWYKQGIDYWQGTTPTNDGVLGGYGKVHDADIADSLLFVSPLLPALREGAPQKKLRALDVGAGIGRVTGGLLLEICDTVDLLEGASKFVAQARLQLSFAGDRVERYICEGMQDFTPDAVRRSIFKLDTGSPARSRLRQRPFYRLEVEKLGVRIPLATDLHSCGVTSELQTSPYSYASCEFLGRQGRYDLVWIQWCIG